MASRSAWWTAAAVAVAVAGAAACGGGASGGGGDGLNGAIAADGSSTVAPLTEVAAELFMGENPGVQITVGTSGTGGGFEKFCNGETDLSDASRPIEDGEAAACEDRGIVYEELQVANDGLTVVVNPANDWASCLTVEQLRAIWEPAAQGEIDNWQQVDPSFPDEPLELFGPGTDSGTFDYFTEAIVGEEGASRSDYTASEDDNVVVQGVAGTEGGLGYFGLSYYEENADELRAVEIDGGGGCVAPSVETVQSGEYTPLSRPLFIYPTRDLLARPEGLAFVEFYEERIDEIAGQAQFVPLTDDQKAEVRREIERLQR